MTTRRLPRLELIPDTTNNNNNNNDFIIFRHQTQSKKVPSFSKKIRKYKSKPKPKTLKKNKTKKHHKSKSIFNIF